MSVTLEQVAPPAVSTSFIVDQLLHCTRAGGEKSELSNKSYDNLFEVDTSTPSNAVSMVDVHVGLPSRDQQLTVDGKTNKCSNDLFQSNAFIQGDRTTSNNDICGQVPRHTVTTCETKCELVDILEIAGQIPRNAGNAGGFTDQMITASSTLSIDHEVRCIFVN